MFLRSLGRPGDPEQLRREMERLSLVAFRIVWVNPRTRSYSCSRLAGGMAAAWPHCDAVVSAHTISRARPAHRGAGRSGAARAKPTGARGRLPQRRGRAEGRRRPARSPAAANPASAPRSARRRTRAAVARSRVPPLPASRRLAQADGQVRHHVWVLTAVGQVAGNARVAAAVSARNGPSGSGASHRRTGSNQRSRAEGDVEGLAPTGSRAASVAITVVLSRHSGGTKG